MVIIGVGGNSYGHPHADALALYQSQGATVYRTDQHGTVVVEAQRSGQYRIAVERGQGARPPPTATTPPPAGRCVDVNTATAVDLQGIIHIGPVRAQEIIGLRRTRPFRSVQELTRVRGIAEIRLRDIMRQGLACVGSQ